MSEEKQSNENILTQSIEEEITQSYIDYSMSVIVSRALPDIRDGLKPVIRRVLYSMYELRFFHNARFKKSANIVGEVMGKFHPHGDSSIYEALVRMAQDFSLRYPLIEGQGNFGSIDGDGAAAMRYTEARLTKIAEEMLNDIHMDTVDRRDNYDNSREEPVFLPTKFPNHLCNGTMGIAVGMATNMAPHNLGEVIDACLLLMDNPDSTVDDIIEIIKGPDFPTGGTIYDTENIKEVYRKGKGGIVLRGKAHIEEGKNGDNIVITEIPYQLNKANFLSKLGEMVNSKKIDGISEITDESNKKDIKITINVRKGVDAENVLTLIYKYTDLQTNFNINNVALTEGGLQPKIMNIKDLLEEFIAFRRKVVYDRSIYQLNKAKDRLHILQGLKKAIDVLDDVVDTIRGSQTRPEAKQQLMEKFEFTDPQAEYILMLRLQTLVGLEIQKILDEIGEKEELINYLNKVIEDEKELDKVVIDEMQYIKDEYADERRTEVSNNPEVYKLESNVKNVKKLEELQKENIILWIGNDFEVKVLYQSRINVIPENTKTIRYTHNQDKIYAITDNGEIVIERLKDLGSHNIKGKGAYLKKHFNLKGDVIFADIISYDFDHILMLTNKNNIKKVKRSLIESFKKTPTKIMGLLEGETIRKVEQVKENDYVGILSNKGVLLIFSINGIRASGKTAGGVKGIQLEEGETVASMFSYTDEPFIFVHSETSGKLLHMDDLKIQKRGQKGMQIASLAKNEQISGGMSIDEGGVTLQLDNGEVVELHSDNIPLKNRNTKLDTLVNGKIKNIYRPWKEKLKDNK